MPLLASVNRCDVDAGAATHSDASRQGSAVEAMVDSARAPQLVASGSVHVRSSDVTVTNGVDGYVPVADRTMRDQFRSPEFAYLFVFTVVHMVRTRAVDCDGR